MAREQLTRRMHLRVADLSSVVSWVVFSSECEEKSRFRDKLRVRMYFPRQNSRDYFLSLFFFFFSGRCIETESALEDY